MTSPIDPWTVINRTDSTFSTISAIMSPVTETQPATETQDQPEPTKVVELTINAKPTSNDQTEEKNEDKEPAPPKEKERSRKLKRTDTQITYSDYDSDLGDVRDRRVNRRRRDYFSPVRVHPIQSNVLLSSSSSLLEKINDYDGVADLPFPARGGVYLTTYPFSDKDVQRWSWLLGSGIEEQWVNEPRKRRVNNDDDDDDDSDDDRLFNRGRGVRIFNDDRRRIRSPGYDPLGNEMSSVFLSRALDTTVVPEEGEEKVKFVIVVQNRSKNGSSAEAARLLVAESRKATAMLMYYEVLNGTSVPFVGAVPANAKLTGSKKKKVQFKKVETVDEAVKLYKEDGVVGVVC